MTENPCQALTHDGLCRAHGGACCYNQAIEDVIKLAWTDGYASNKASMAITTRQVEALRKKVDE